MTGDETIDNPDGFSEPSFADKVRICLEMIDAGTAYCQPPRPGYTGPLPTDVFIDALLALGPLGTVRVTCSG